VPVRVGQEAQEVPRRLSAPLSPIAIGTGATAAALDYALWWRLRARTADLAALIDVANGLTDAQDFATALCTGARDAAGADAVVLLTVADGEFTVLGRSGSQVVVEEMIYGALRARLADAWLTGEPVVLPAQTARRGRRPGARCRGLAQPVLRDGQPAGILALAFAVPRRRGGDRLRWAARRFGAQASMAMERAERLSQAPRRQALQSSDDVVQGLVVARYAMEAGQVQEASEAIDRTLAGAREIVSAQLEGMAGADGQVRPGDLVRREAESPLSD